MTLLLLGSCTKKEAPSAPTNLTAVLMNNDCIHLSWKKVPHADYYRITVGFQIRDNLNQLLSETREVILGEIVSHSKERIITKSRLSMNTDPALIARCLAIIP